MLQRDIAREAIFGFVGASIAIAGLRSFQAAARSTKWPRTSAKVVGARVIERPSRGDDATPTIYAIEISYEFVVQGETHLKSHVEPERISWSLASLAEGQLKRYPNGVLVDICTTRSARANRCWSRGGRRHWVPSLQSRPGP